MSKTIESLIEKIFYSILLFTALGFLLNLYFPSLVNIKTSLDESQQSEFRKAVVLENLLKAHPDPDQKDSLNYDLPDRRSVLAAEYFTREASNGEIGYRINNGKCYIPGLKGLNGRNYGFKIYVLEQNPYSIPGSCRTVESPANSLYSPALIKGEQGTTPVRLSVYETG